MRALATWHPTSEGLRSPVLRYGLSVVCVAIALGLGIAFESHGFRSGQFGLFGAAIAVAAWYGRTGPAVVAAVLSVACFDYFFTRPPYHIFAVSPEDLPYFITFVAWTLVVAGFSTALRHTADRLQREVAQRKQREDALRRSEMYLAAAQRLSHTGSFGWHPASGEIYWSDETYRMFECEPTIRPTPQLVLERTHPDDRERLRQILERAAIEEKELVAEHRLMMADGSIKYLRTVAYRSSAEEPKGLVFAGAVMDITERKRAEEERERLHQLEADLAHMNRVTMMGELAASLAHEIKQPITAAALHAQTCSLWLGRDAPHLTEATNSASGVVRALKRAAAIVDRVSSLYKRGRSEREPVDLNQMVREMTALVGNVANRNSTSVRIELDPGLPMATADRIQLQQVLMNLMLNGIEAMQDTGGELTIASKKTEDDQLLISVSDSGVGFPVDESERIFDAFFTTKPQGTGMGLSISRRIIAAHGGRLWASANTGRGAVFRFTVPIGTSQRL